MYLTSRRYNCNELNHVMHERSNKSRTLIRTRQMSKEKKTYTAALIIIGNEILSGRTQDTNTAWLAERLVSRGVRMVEARTIPDYHDVIISSVRELSQKVDYVFTTGGIGPTHDDITTECIAAAFDLKLVEDKEARNLLLDYYGAEELTESRLKMAKVPEGARLIPNPVTAAPGFNVANVYVMAGVPRIMQGMFDHVVDMIEIGDPVLSNTVSCQLPESVVAADLGTLQEKYPDIEIGSYPHYRGGVLGLSIVLRSVDEDILGEATKEVIDIIHKYGDTPRALNIRSSETIDL